MIRLILILSRQGLRNKAVLKIEVKALPSLIEESCLTLMHKVYLKSVAPANIGNVFERALLRRTVKIHDYHNITLYWRFVYFY